ncbi:hypothetical protein H6G76_28140 [Nostoc sp. FACHB-152]|uniref:hypothetical protein n=1 Tax=unclassified Nostoc TaxID=2593658 RepID=UPI001682E9EA|nr:MULTISPECIES: hypothetical protein [unclassified Nostoc]MBD2450930.1 hypothetical protein [Nostoc sp. FACHB-152]MBD2471290.1 hypothetical protein [Nostoc sp. FACHB-145]
MLEILLIFVEKHPKKAAAIGGLVFILFLFVSIIIAPPTPHTQEQAQIQVDEPLDQPDEESFDGSQCKVYTVGIVAGAIIHQFKTTSNTWAYVMVTNREEVVKIFENRNLYLWKTQPEFQSTEYAELVQVLPTESIQELNRLLSIYPYVAMGTEAIAKSAQPTIFDSNKCSVD